MKRKYKDNIRQKSVMVMILSSIAVSGIYAQNKMLNTQVNATGIQWESEEAAGNFMLRVTGPDGFMYEKTFTGVAPSIYEFGSDGQYRYEITALPVISKATREKMRNARETNNASLMKTLTVKSKKQSGYFRVVGGAIVNSNIQEKRSTK